MTRKLSLALLALALAAGVGLWGWSILRKETAPLAELIKEIPANVDIDISARGVTLSQGAEGRKDWQLTANSASYNQETNQASVIEPRITYFPKDDGAPVKVSAPSGLVDQAANAVKLGPDVAIDWQELSIRGRELSYLGANRTLVLSGEVVAHRGESQLDAPQITINLDTKELSAGSPVRFTTLTPAFGREKGGAK